MSRRESISSQHRSNSDILDGQLSLGVALCPDCGVTVAQARIGKRKHRAQDVEIVCMTCGGPVIEEFGCRCGG